MDRTALLIVEDDPHLREQMRWGLESEYTVYEAEDRSTAVAVLRRERPSLVTLDLGLPPSPDDPKEGLATLDECLTVAPLAKVIVITGGSDRTTALCAIQQGAYDYLQKPVQLDLLRVILQRARYLSQIEQENRSLQEGAGGTHFHEILGTSQPMQEVFKTIRKVAGSDTPVLILGESGTGKELAARAIHRESARREGPFITINCGAIPETLLESELFGHEKGAFTGAHVQRKGRVESAQGGALFLDEIGELPLALQVKLLRFLQNQSIVRVGGREEIRVDARIIAATNVDLVTAMKEGRFREDVYYRINVIVLSMPPLRERGEDIRLLAYALLRRYARQHAKKIIGFSRQAVLAMETYAWPGNVRELENRIHRAVILAEGQRVIPEDLQLAAAPACHEGRTLKETRSSIEKELIQQTLAKYHGNITRAARELGVSRPTLHQLISKHVLQR